MIPSKSLIISFLSIAVATGLLGMNGPNLACAQPATSPPGFNPQIGEAVGRAPGAINWHVGTALDRDSLRRLNRDANGIGRQIPKGETREYDSLWRAPEGGFSRYDRLVPAQRGPAFVAPSSDYRPVHRPPPVRFWSAPICIDPSGWRSGSCPTVTPSSRPRP